MDKFCTLHAAVIHMLGFIETPDHVADEISEYALKVAINMANWHAMVIIFFFAS